MSGIAGIYSLGKQPIPPERLERMMDPLEHRGPDGSGIWARESVGLGQQYFDTARAAGPETRRELPFVSGPFVIVCDARIDNRNELIRACSKFLSPNRQPADAELVLAAYQKWGRACPERLVGAFAFAIWDGREQELFCARDQFGIKPFYYHHAQDRTFVFGSEIKALLAAGVPREVNDTRVVDYLIGVCDNKRYTFFDEILRLPPAHSCVVTRSGMSQYNYWTLSPGEELEMESPSAYEAGFRERFSEAVECRLSGANRTGAFLSGGLDSASIVSVMQQLACSSGRDSFQTFSAVFDELEECDERDYIRSVVERGCVSPHFITLDRYNPISDLPDIVDVLDEPMVGHLFNLTWRLAPTVRSRGIDIMLDGHGGDEVVSHGFSLFHDLARNGRWLKLYRELGGMDHNLSRPQMAAYYWLTHSSLPSSLRQRLWRTIARFGSPASTSSPSSGPLWKQLMADEFAADMNADERFQANRRRAMGRNGDTNQHYETLTNPLQVRAFEELNLKSAFRGMESRFPFWDRRLVTYCLALPITQKRDDGQGRQILRRAMKDILPERIRTRPGKTVFTPSVIRSMRENRSTLEAQFDEIADDLAPYVSAEKFGDLVRSEWRGDDFSAPASVDMLGKILMLGFWLRAD